MGRETEDMGISKWDYCQYLLASPVNYTLTNMADHLEGVSHDRLNRYLRGEKLTPRLLWENVRAVYQSSPNGFLLFDDTVLDKSNGPCIETTRQQWSGNAHAIVRGIGLVSCVYVNPEAGLFWVIDYRLFDPDTDGKSKLDHMREMLQSVRHRQIPFTTVLMDAWYATREMMLLIENWNKHPVGGSPGSSPGGSPGSSPGGSPGSSPGSSPGKRFYCPLKSNRKVDDSGGERPYRAVSALEWSREELQSGKRVKVHGFPADYKMTLFRVEVSIHRTEYIVTNDATQDSTSGTRKVCAVRWKIEQVHRELKQLTGLERCQCRKARIQRNHIHCALLVWTRLNHLAQQARTTVYQLKHGLLREFLVQQLRQPAIQMCPA